MLDRRPLSGGSSRTVTPPHERAAHAWLSLELKVSAAPLGRSAPIESAVSDDRPVLAVTVPILLLVGAAGLAAVCLDICGKPDAQLVVAQIALSNAGLYLLLAGLGISTYAKQHESMCTTS